MTADTSPRTVQICRTCGGGAPVDVHFCPQCTKILTLGRRGDYFTFLGIPRKLNVDVADLEQRFRALSRQFHPDYFYNAAPGERRASLERSSYLNDAYRTLKQPISRIAYLLELEGVWTMADRTDGSGASKLVPPALLEEVFALNEELDEVREIRAAGAPSEVWTQRLQTARQPIDGKRAEHERRIEELSAKWDAVLDRGGSQAERSEVLNAMRELMLERNYITNLLASIDREAAGAAVPAPGLPVTPDAGSTKPGPKPEARSHE
jgi:molecular chaperone HscB